MKRDYSHIHPELQKIARSSPPITFTRKNLWLMRFLTRLQPPSKPLEDVHIENIIIPGDMDQTKIRLRIYKLKSSSAPTPVLIWYHGGGYIMGIPEMDDQRCTSFVQALGITVVSVDYRIAPQYPFPNGLEDSYSALKWVAAHATQLNIDPGHIAIGGQSAGAGLAASLAQLAHDRNEIQPIFQLLVYPMLDDRTVLREDNNHANHIVWNQHSNRFGWQSYLGKHFGAEDIPAYAVPARRNDLSGLPPAWVGIGTLDLFYDEAMTYAQRLKDAGIDCEVKTVPGAFHGFDVFDPKLPVVEEFLRSQIAALKQYLYNGSDQKGTP